MVPFGDVSMYGNQILPLAIALKCCSIDRFFRDSNSRPVGQFAYRIGEWQVFVFHNEGQGVAAGATAEAIVKLLVRIDAERGGFLVVKRAAGGVVLAGLFQFDAAVYHLDDVEAVQ